MLDTVVLLLTLLLSTENSQAPPLNEPQSGLITIGSG